MIPIKGKIFGEEYDFSLDKLFPKSEKIPPTKSELRKLKKIRTKRRIRRQIANASRSKNRG